MGVRGLYTLMKKMPGSFKDINILEELHNYRSRNGTAPVIVINLWTMANHFMQNERDYLVGSRLNMIEQKFDAFLKKLADAGAEMIFTFKKTQVKETGFVSAQENHYQKALELLNSLKMIGDFNQLKEGEENKEIPYNHSVMIVLCQVAGRYGDLHGMDSIHSSMSASQVKLANENKALAIMSLDTQILFYSGSWVFWSDADLDMEKMTIRQFDKEKILAHLNVPIEKAHLFCMLAGSLDSSEENIEEMIEFFRPYHKLIPKVAKFVNKTQFPLTDKVLRTVITKVMGRCTQELFEDFKRSLEIKDLKSCTETSNQIDPEVMEHIQGGYANFAEEILESFPIYLSPVYLDLSSSDVKIHDLVIPFIQKSAGILLNNHRVRSPTAVFYKKSCGEEFSKVTYPAILPKFEVPSLLTIVSGEIFYEKKLKYLLWMSGLELAIKDLKSIPNDFVVDAIICAHLVKNKAMTANEARCLMKSIVVTKDIDAPTVALPQQINERAFRLGFLYQKLFFVFHSCIAAIGLKIFQTSLRFDGAHFQKVFATERVAEQPISSKVLFRQLINIVSNSERNFNSMMFEDKKISVKIDKLCEEKNFLKKKFIEKLDQAEVVQPILRENPRNVEALYSSGFNQYFEAKFIESISSFSAALEIFPDCKETKKLLKKARRLLYLLRTGLKLSKAENYDEAIKTFGFAIRTDPTNLNVVAKMLCYRGFSYYNSGRLDEALEDFAEALSINEAHSEALYHRASIHFDNEEFAKCIIDCEAALSAEVHVGTQRLLKAAQTSLKLNHKRRCFEILDPSATKVTSCLFKLKTKRPQANIQQLRRRKRLASSVKGSSRCSVGKASKNIEN